MTERRLTVEYDIVATIRPGVGRCWFASYFGLAENPDDQEALAAGHGWQEAYSQLSAAKKSLMAQAEDHGIADAKWERRTEDWSLLVRRG